MGGAVKLFAEFHHSGDHEGAWRLPTARPDRTDDASYYVERARIAAGGGFSHVFFADFVGYDPVVRHQVRWPFEPTTLLAAVAATVPDIGVVATGSTVFASPDDLVDTFATLQDVSGGRAGWNIVTAGAPAAAAALGRDAVPAHDARYDAADAVVDHVRAAFTEETRPLFVQAGASPRGRTFAARHADAVFAATPDRDAARAFREDLHARAAALGRPAPLLLPGFLVTLGSTDEEARRRRRQLDDLLSDGTIATLLDQFGLDLPGVGLDDRLPADLTTGAGFQGIRSRAAVLDAVARELGPDVTLRRLVRHVAGSRGHLQHTGTPEAVAGIIADWVGAGAADGFVVKFSHNPGGAEDFVDGVTPLLRARGLLDG
ncbi:LLM class flavin-dependent oxidoreductase [Actinomycetospora flava]|uniref:LLM class flavin-dependent oxidoreductase n=1 Tax=Actinomycetospora flava TaxID=3129232 RepID=A0ABU8M2N3_9PSEU